MKVEKGMAILQEGEAFPQSPPIPDRIAMLTCGVPDVQLVLLMGVALKYFNGEGKQWFRPADLVKTASPGSPHGERNRNTLSTRMNTFFDMLQREKVPGIFKVKKNNRIHFPISFLTFQVARWQFLYRETVALTEALTDLFKSGCFGPHELKMVAKRPRILHEWARLREKGHAHVLHGLKDGPPQPLTKEIKGLSENGLTQLMWWLNMAAPQPEVKKPALQETRPGVDIPVGDGKERKVPEPDQSLDRDEGTRVPEAMDSEPNVKQEATTEPEPKEDGPAPNVKVLPEEEQEPAQKKAEESLSPEQPAPKEEMTGKMEEAQDEALTGPKTPKGIWKLRTASAAIMAALVWLCIGLGSPSPLPQPLAESKSPIPAHQPVEPVREQKTAAGVVVGKNLHPKTMVDEAFTMITGGEPEAALERLDLAQTMKSISRFQYAKSVFYQGKAYTKMGDLEMASTKFKEADLLFCKIPNTYGSRMLARNEGARVHFLLNDLEQASKTLSEDDQRVKNPDIKFNRLAIKAKIDAMKGNYREVLISADEMLRLQQSGNYASQAYGMMSLASVLNDDLVNAYYYKSKAEALMEKGPSSENARMYLLCTDIIYCKKTFKDPESAINRVERYLKTSPDKELRTWLDFAKDFQDSKY